MKKCNSIKLASFAVLLAGTVLFTPGFTVTASQLKIFLVRHKYMIKRIVMAGNK